MPRSAPQHPAVHSYNLIGEVFVLPEDIVSDTSE